MPRILVDALGATHGGIVRVLEGVLNELAAIEGVDVDVVNCPEVFDHCPDGIRVLNWQSRARPLSIVVAAGRTMRTGYDLRVDIAPSLTPIRSRRRLTIVHDLAYRDHSLRYISTHQRLYRSYAIKTALRKADRVVVINPDLLKQVQALSRSRTRPELRLLPWPVTQLQMHGPISGPREAWVLALCGAPNKGFEYIVDAALCDPALEFRVVSGASLVPRLQERVQALGLNERIRFVADPTDDELWKMYAKARAFVMPSRFEGFGLPAVEALSMATPTVISDIPALTFATRGRAITTQLSGEGLARAIRDAHALSAQHWLEAAGEVRAWNWNAWYVEAFSGMADFG